MTKITFILLVLPPPKGFLDFTRREFKVLEIEGVQHNISIMSGNNTGENVTRINSILF